MQTLNKTDMFKSGNVIIVYKFPDNTKNGYQTENLKQSTNKSNYYFTAREMEVLKLLVEGETNAQIANDLVISIHTAKAHVCNIMQKMGVSDRVKAAVMAVRNNIV